MAVKDPHFLTMGMDAPFDRDEQYFAYSGVQFKVPKRFSSTALVICGDFSFSLVGILTNCSGWVVSVPTSAEFDWGFLRRLGIEESQTAFVLFDESWDRLGSVVRFAESSPILLVNRNKAGNGAEILECAARVENILLNSAKRPTPICMYVSRAQADSVLDLPIDLVVYPDNQHIGEREGAWTSWFQAIGSICDVMVSGGALSLWLRKLGRGLVTMPNPYFLDRFVPTGALSRVSYLDLFISGERLHVRGFDVSDKARSDGWGTRSHYLVFVDQDGVEHREQLGMLRRENLDDLAIGTSTTSNAYAAFSTPGNKGISLAEFAPGKYTLRVFDRDGYPLHEHSRIRVTSDGALADGRYVLEKLAGGEIRLEVSADHHTNN